MEYNWTGKTATYAQWGGTRVLDFKKASSLMGETGMYTTGLLIWEWITCDHGQT